MRAIRPALLAAVTAMPLMLARPASAECPPEDPACRLSPAQSVEVHDDPSWARGTLDVVPEPGSLTSVPIPDFFVAAIPLDSPAPAIPRLQVPLRLQDPSDVSCGVQALGMALAGLEGAAPASGALLGMLQGSGIMSDFGTGVEELAYAAQTFGYRGSLAFHGWSLAELRAQLDAGHPVVVALGTNGEGVPGHFVTVTGISADGEWVAYSDPALGERVVPIGEFLAQWGAQGNSGVLVAHEPPSSPSGAVDLFPWVAFAAALMALVSTTPLVTWRKGIGGTVIEESERPFDLIETDIVTWKLVPRYKTIQEPLYKKVMVEKTIMEPFPVYETVIVQDGWDTWTEKKAVYGTEKYISGYRKVTKQVPEYMYIGGRKKLAGC